MTCDKCFNIDETWFEEVSFFNLSKVAKLKKYIRIITELDTLESRLKSASHKILNKKVLSCLGNFLCARKCKESRMRFVHANQLH